MPKIKDADIPDTLDPSVVAFVEACVDEEFAGPMPHFSSTYKFGRLGQKYRCVCCGNYFPISDEFWGPKGDCITCTKNKTNGKQNNTKAKNTR